MKVQAVVSEKLLSRITIRTVFYIEYTQYQCVRPLQPHPKISHPCEKMSPSEERAQGIRIEEDHVRGTWVYIWYAYYVAHSCTALQERAYCM